MSRKSKEIKIGIAIMATIVAIAWAIYTAYYMGVRIHIPYHFYMVLTASIGGMIVMIGTIDELKYEYSSYHRRREIRRDQKEVAEEKKRAVKLLIFYQSSIWTLFVLSLFAGYFRTEIFGFITASIYTIIFCLGGVFWIEWIKDGMDDELLMVAKSAIVGIVLTYGFYTAYYFDGPYCDSWGYCIAAFITTLLATVGYAAWQYDGVEE